MGFYASLILIFYSGMQGVIRIFSYENTNNTEERMGLIYLDNSLSPLEKEWSSL